MFPFFIMFFNATQFYISLTTHSRQFPNVNLWITLTINIMLIYLVKSHFDKRDGSSKGTVLVIVVVWQCNLTKIGLQQRFFHKHFLTAGLQATYV